MLDEDVTLVSYDANWQDAFAAESRRIREALELSADTVEHIGSTAVPGLAAKPVVDMMLGASKLPAPPEWIWRLASLGYEDLGEAGVPGRIYLRLRDAPREFNLHIVERGGIHWINNLALREFLRTDAAARERYAAAKLAALRSAGPRLLAYSAAKHEAVTELLNQARAR
jgi:GrpB-like predicted nucleotidyltransferase (UPF0157 family)